ncbi:hypothetical protein SAMN04487943_102133 [Gracilibacillus orientalis]|uniref:YhfM-like domain-containing protein n=1 Tax=Gracilibacillus orientalis TaxID=334253 RepID=A0A1I4II62_9BACI|nr:hypothetical protein [Gracilibacillus orientalis]SFL54079.1 hypothetical protein SAMN04487943_102133 [Gracilibacillus orientalis]
MRNIFLLLLLFFSALTLIGCQSQSKEMMLLDNVSSISISESKGYGGLNENYFASFNQDEIIAEFEEIFKNTEVTNQDATYETPTYDILVRYENDATHGLHLILGDEGEESLFIYVGNENNIYSVSSEATNKLRKMID